MVIRKKYDLIFNFTQNMPTFSKYISTILKDNVKLYPVD